MLASTTVNEAVTCGNAPRNALHHMALKIHMVKAPLTFTPII
jgi:hypothetical protein